MQSEGAKKSTGEGLQKEDVSHPTPRRNPQSSFEMNGQKLARVGNIWVFDVTIA